MVTATQSAHETELAGRVGRGAGDKISAVLNAEKRSSAACQFERALRQKIVGQEEAVEALVDLYQMFCADLQSPSRPIGNLLFLGPTGTGTEHSTE
jgi:ATP-dependent Clp protease ATP-binding subunit ClpB